MDKELQADKAVVVVVVEAQKCCGDRYADHWMMESDSDEIYREIGIGCDFPDDGVGDGSDEIFHENEISHESENDFGGNWISLSSDLSCDCDFDGFDGFDEIFYDREIHYGEIDADQISLDICFG